MMQYDGDLKLPANFLVPPPAINHVSGQYLAANGVSTFACSETQKFGHVTFFWNGNRSGYFSEDLETFVEVCSSSLMIEFKAAHRCFEGCHTISAACLVCSIAAGLHPPLLKC